MFALMQCVLIRPQICVDWLWLGAIENIKRRLLILTYHEYFCRKNIDDYRRYR